MPSTFADVMNRVEAKNQEQRLQLANTFLPIFQSIAQKKAIDEQYQLEQTRQAEAKAKAQQEQAAGLAKMGVTVDPTMPTNLQMLSANRQFNEQDKLKETNNSVTGLVSLLPENLKKEFDAKSLNLTPDAQLTLAKTLAKRHEDTISDERELAMTKEKYRLALQYSPTMNKPDEVKQTAGERKLSNELNRGKTYSVTVDEQLKDGTKRKVTKTFIVQKGNIPQLGGGVLITTDGEKQYAFNSKSWLVQGADKVWRKDTPPVSVRTALSKAFSDSNSLITLSPYSASTNGGKMDNALGGKTYKEFDGLFGGK